MTFFDIMLTHSYRLLKGHVLNENLLNYLPILLFIMFAMIICIAFVFSAFLVGNQNPDPEKNMPFECGFDAFEDTMMSIGCQEIDSSMIGCSNIPSG